MHVKQIYLPLLLIGFCLNGFAKDFGADDVVGFWLSESKKGVVEIYKKDNGKFEGKLVWIKDIFTGKVKDKKDKENPDKDKRDRSLLGLVNLKDFSFDDDEWNGGTIYDPEKGKTYKAYMQLKDKNNLKLRGYIGFALIGRTTKWERQQGPVPDSYANKLKKPESMGDDKKGM